MSNKNTICWNAASAGDVKAASEQVAKMVNDGHMRVEGVFNMAATLRKHCFGKFQVCGQHLG